MKDKNMELYCCSFNFIEDLEESDPNSDGIYILGWDGDFVVFMLDHDGNLRWAKRINQGGLAEDIYVDDESVYIVESFKGKSLLLSFDPANDAAHGIALSGCGLKDITVSNETVYCVGSAQSQSIKGHLVNLTISDMDVKVTNFNWSLNYCNLTLSDAKGSFTDFTIGSGEKSDILIARIDKLNRR